MIVATDSPRVKLWAAQVVCLSVCNLPEGKGSGRVYPLGSTEVSV